MKLLRVDQHSDRRITLVEQIVSKAIARSVLKQRVLMRLLSVLQDS